MKKILSLVLGLTLLGGFVPFAPAHADAAEPDTDSPAATSTQVLLPQSDVPEASSTDMSKDTGDEAASSTDKQQEGTPKIQMLRTLAVTDSAPSPVSIDLEIDTASGTLYSGQLDVSACAPEDGGDETVNAYCALEESGVPVTWTWYDFGSPSAFLDTAGGVGNGNGSDNYWTWFSDGDAGETGLNAHELHSGEKLLVTIDRMPMKLSVSEPSPRVGSSTVVTVLGFNAWDFAYEPVTGATIVGGAAEATDASGQASITATSTNSFSIHAEASGYLPSDSVTITPKQSHVPASIPIHLEIDTETETLFAGSLDVSACDTSPDSGDQSVNAYCAIEQSGIDSDWSWYGDDAFINSLGGVSNDYSGGNYWDWFSDLVYGQSALNKHVLTSGEHVLVTIGRLPLMVTATPSTPQVGASTTLSVTQFGFDDSFNGIWTPASGSSITANGLVLSPDENGAAHFTATSTDPVTVSATKNGYLPYALSFTPSAASSTDSETGGNGGGGNGGSHTPDFDTDAAFSYLQTRQQGNGSFGGETYTDWAAFPLALSDAPQAMRSMLTSYLRSDSPDLVSATDYERHIMALEALGINPYDAGGRDYVSSLADMFDGTQIGDKLTDNIFAVLPLLHTGYTKNDPIIQNTVAYIVSQQNGNGSWEGGVDTTAAAVQQLSAVSSLPHVSSAISKARGYLKAAQGTDGSVGNPDSTSWTLQAIAALGENPSNWSIGTSTPLTYLASVQQPDGSVKYGSETADASLWSTEYAIPAAQGRSWDDLLESFAKTVTIGSGTGASASSTTATSTTATSTSATVSTPLLLVAPEDTATTTATARIYATPKPLVPENAAVAATASAPEDAGTTSTQEAAVASAPLAVSLVNSVMHFFAGAWYWFTHLFAPFLTK